MHEACVNCCEMGAVIQCYLRARWWLGISLLGVLWSTACAEDRELVAYLARIHGQVTVAPGGVANREGELDEGLVPGDVVSTGADSAAVLVFVVGTKLELGAHTSLVLRRGGGTAATMGAVLLGGVARASSAEGRVSLTIGTPFGFAEIGTGAVDLVVSAEHGLRVLVGQVSVLGDAGVRTAVKAGEALTVAGLVVTIGGQTSVSGLRFPLRQDAVADLFVAADAGVADIVLQPLTFVLLANSKQTLVRRAGSDAWTRPKKRDDLGPGDSVRTRRSGALVRFADAGDVVMQGSSQVQFDEALQGSGVAKVAYGVKHGGISLQLSKRAGVVLAHTVAVLGQAVTVTPGTRSADVDISCDETSADVRVRAGKAVLGDGTQVLAGQAVHIEGDGKVGAVRPLAVPWVTVAPGSQAVIHYRNSPPAVGFRWSTGESTVQIFELASDAQLRHVRYHEAIAGGYLVLEKLPEGDSFWRVAGKPAGFFSLQLEGDADCANCRRNNVIKDTGEKTVVYFQQALPAITLRWDTRELATQYNVKVFADGQFDTPLADVSSKKNRHVFPAGDLEEGVYFWHVEALDASGSVLARGKMNRLEIAYDNAVTALVIKSPAPEQRLRDSAVTTRGEIEQGAEVFINDKAVELDGEGRFAHTVPLVRGLNTLVYRVVTKERVEHFYVRRVQRR